MSRWAELRDLVEKKREKLTVAHSVQTFHIDCTETVTWIRDKAKLIESTDELGNDLAGIITLQRRLSGMERDLAAIQARVSTYQPYISIILTFSANFRLSSNHF